MITTLAVIALATALPLAIGAVLYLSQTRSGDAQAGRDTAR